MSSQAVIPKPTVIACISENPELLKKIINILDKEITPLREYTRPESALSDLYANNVAFEALLLDMPGHGTTAGISLLRRTSALALTDGDAEGEAAMAAGACVYLPRELVSRETLLLALRYLRQRKHDVAALRHEQERYYELFENANDLIYLRDRQGRIIDWNLAGERLTGYGRQEMLGHDLREIVVPEQRELAQRMHERKLAGEPATRYRLSVLGKDGRRIELEVNSRPLFSRGQVTGVHGIARDITEQVQAESALRQHQEQFERLFIEMPYGMAFLDLEDRIMRVNPAMERMFGHRFEEREKIKLENLIHPDDLALTQAAREEYERGGDICIRKRYLRRSGEVLWAEVRTARIHDELGRHIFTLALVQDIGEIMRITGELRESEERYRVMAESSVVGMCNIDEESRILFANPAMERIFGYSAEELRGQSLTLLMPPDYRARHLAGFHRYLETGTRKLNWESVELPGWHREQREIQIEVAFSETRRQGKKVFYGIIRDVSARHLATLALRDSERRYQRLMESISVGITISDRRHNLHEVNRSFCELLGYSPEEMIGRPFYEFTSPEDIPAHIQRHNDLLAGRIESYTLQKRYRSKNGQTVWTQAEGRLLSVPKDGVEAGEELYVLTSVEDISQRVRLQEKLSRAERLESVGRMAAGLAHDFSNYLTVINAAARMLQNQYRETGERRSAWREPLEKIVSAGERAAAMTEQLLAIGRQQPAPVDETLDLNRILSHLAPTLEALLVPSAIELKLHLVSQPLWIRTRASQVEQIATNLAINARNAMPTGGRLEITSQVLHLDRPLSTLTTELPAGDYVRLSVRDQGTGMDQATQAHIFEPFFTTRSEQGGTGLGLATVYILAEQNHAGLLVASQPGQGAEFQLLWRASGPAPIHAPASERQRILVVDDEEGVRWLMRSVLELAGYDVQEAGGPLEALNLQERWDKPPDLVVSDFLMPEMTGPELLTRLRAHWPGLKSLLVSAYNASLPPDALAGQEPLRKPFTPEALLERVRKLLE